MEKTATIYKITNKKTEEIYIGETSQTLYERLLVHFKHMREGRGTNKLYDDMRKQDKKDFVIEKIDECFYRHRFIIEQYWTEKYIKEGYPVYNKKLGNELPKSVKQRISEVRNKNKEVYHSEEFKEKMSEATRGEKNGMFNKKDEEAVNGRVVVALDGEGNVKHTFNSVKTALKFVGIKGHTGLNKAVREQTLWHGYYWKKEWVNR